MPNQIHDDEPDTSEAVVRALLADECPQWAEIRLKYLDNSGTDNAMWRGTTDDDASIVVRLPRRPGAAEGSEREYQLLERLKTTPLPAVVATPQPLHAGSPHDFYPHRWSVLAWLEGSDAWTARREVDEDSPTLAARLAEVVVAIGGLGDGLPVPNRAAGDRGGPIRPLARRLLAMLDGLGPSAARLFDIGRARQLAAEALDVDDTATPGFVHGDLIPGNLLVQTGQLTGVLDWGSAGYGDRAQDLAPAWSILGSRGRQIFREILAPDEATWLRGRTIELSHAIGGVLYYMPRRHALGDVMAATLKRILSES